MTDGRVCLGWQFALPYPDPGPRPKRPVPSARPALDPGWVAAQRREENALDRPLRVVAWVAGLSVIAVAGGLVAGALDAVLATLAAIVCVIVGGVSGIGVWQGERALRARIVAEADRVERFRAEADNELVAAQSEHARQMKDWQARRFAHENQKRWYAVALPSGIDRVDVAGGTLQGWSALATTIGAQRLASGGEVTVVDASGGPVAADLIAVARAMGSDPLVWVLPVDLARLDLARELDGGALADALAVTARSAADPTGGSGAGELSADTALCERVLGALGSAEPPRVLAALRVLAGIGDPLSDVDAGLLTADEVVRLSTMFGHEQARRLAAERAWHLVAALGPLEVAGTAVAPLPHSRLRVLAVDPAVGSAQQTALGTFAVAALSGVLRRASSGPVGWDHTLLVFGADRLAPGVVDRLADACTASGTGLMLAFRTITPAVRARLGRGNTAVAFMRLGNAEDAKAASEQIGTEQRFVLAQLTETVGSSMTDTVGATYTSTVSASSSVTDSSTITESRGTGSGRSAAGGPLPGPGSRSTQASSSRTQASGESVTEGISTSSAWGISTSRAMGDSESRARSLQRSRELIVEPHELQRLPVTSLILSYASTAARSVILADVNPGIGTLPAATGVPLAEAAMTGTAVPAPPESNLGPPPERLDWRRAHPKSLFR